MRTGAIFARGSCRALKWAALAGMMLALGAGQAAAQIALVGTAPTSFTEGTGTPIEVEFKGMIGANEVQSVVVLRVTATGAKITDGFIRVDVPANTGSEAKAFTTVKRTFTVTPDSDPDAADGTATVTFTLDSAGGLKEADGTTDVTAPAALTSIPVKDDETQRYALNLLTRSVNRVEGQEIEYRIEADPPLVSGADAVTVSLRLDKEYMITGDVVSGTNTSAGEADVSVSDTASPSIMYMVPKDKDSDDQTVTLTAFWGTRTDGGETSHSVLVRDPDDPAPSAPAAPTVTATPSNGEVMLTWAAVDGATKYQYAYARTGSTMGDWMPEAGQTTRSATVEDLTNEMEYTFYVRAGNDVGYGEAGMDTATPTAQEPTTPAGPTDADVKSISIEGEEARSIGGTRRLHLMEGDRTELSITLDWSVQQLRDIYKADSTPSPVMVYFRVVGKMDGADWLSPIDLTGDDRDVLDPEDAVSVKIPAKPKTTANANARVSSAAGKVRFAILEDDDAEDEAFYIEVLADMSAGVSSRTTSGNKLTTGTYVIDDDETQGLKIKRTSKGVIYETSDDQEFEITADPELVELKLDIRLDLTTADGSAVSRVYDVSPTSDTIDSGGKSEVTVDLDNNDGNRMDDDLELHAQIVSRTRADVEDASLAFTVLDVHKLPLLTVSRMEGDVDEGDEIELTLTLDRNPRDTRAASSETRQYTAEAVEVMLSGGAGTTAGMSDYRLPATVKFDEHNGKAPWTQEMKVEVMALEDDDLDDGEMLVLDAMVAGTKTANGEDKMSYAGVSMLTIGESTGKLVWAKSPEEVEAVVSGAKKEGMGEDMTFTAGEMIELEGNDLFGSAEGVSVGYSVAVEGDAVSESVSGGVVTITAESMGMARVTITARASRPSGTVTINDQTDPREASITVALEVGLVALSIELSGPEDMNLIEGGMGGMVTAIANRAVTENTVVNLMRDRAKSSADNMDYTAEPITILAGQMKGSTMVMAVADNMMENESNMAEELVLYGMAADNAGEVMGEVKFYLWDAAVPALPIIAQLLLAVFLAVGGYRRYRRR